MKPYEIVLAYLEIYFSAENLQNLLELLEPELSFNGPLYQFTNAASYVDCLIKDPAIHCDYEIIQINQMDHVIEVHYQMIKPETTFMVKQRFEIINSKIAAITLDFDTSQI